MSSPLRHCDSLVIFGITGDLARTKLFGALYDLALLDRLEARVVGVARSDWSDDDLRANAVEAITATRGRDGPLDPEALARVTDSLGYVQGEYADPATYRRLGQRLGGGVPLFYLAVPPSVFEEVADGVAGLELEGSRLLIEKPFGHDRASAEALQAHLARNFDEKHLFRIDHFLGKEEVQNLELLRFANAFLNPLWDRESIERVTITMAEERGVDDRGSFYDANGATRDVVQNHLLQLVAVLAMEPPAGPGSEADREAVEAVLAATGVAADVPVVMGQYDGYHETSGVASGSITETFVDLTLDIDTDRWRGVPWRLIAGKAMDQTLTEIEVVLRPVASPDFLHTAVPGPNRLWITLKPYEQVRLSAEVRAPGLDIHTTPARLETVRDYRDGEASPSVDAYAILFDAARRGDHEPFASLGSILESWRIVDPVLADPPPLARYPVGAPGPDVERRGVERPAASGPVDGS